MKDKKWRLREIANEVYRENSVEMDKILVNLGMSREQVVEQYVKYDYDVSSYSNEIYESLVQRAVLYLHYLNSKSYHTKRQEAVRGFLGGLEGVESIVDIGFAIPAFYMKDIVRGRDKVLDLLDLYPSAEKFSREVFHIVDSKFEDVVRFRQYDMDSGESVGDYDCYIFMDSIEHAREPSGVLEKVVGEAARGSKFVFGLPISPIVPCHYIEFRDVDVARDWLKAAGLRIEDEKVISSNPEADLFAEEHGGFDNYLCLCERK